MQNNFNVQGHRGCRGLMPENTVPAFLHAIEMGCNTIELDVVICNGSNVLVSHEPWFNHEIITQPNGNLLTEDEGKSFNLFKMSYEEIFLFDAGEKFHNRFPLQKKLKVHKPLLKDVFASVKNYCTEHGKSLPYINIEIKSSKEQEEKNYQPSFELFASLVMEEILLYYKKEFTIVQSFDVRILQFIKNKFHDQTLALLIEYNNDYNGAIKQLGFNPHIYSCHYSDIEEKMIADLHSQFIKVIPWTVNHVEDMKQLIEWNVDGIITDYPDVLLNLIGH